MATDRDAHERKPGASIGAIIVNSAKTIGGVFRIGRQED